MSYGEWQPIETAPRDGTEILIWAPDWVDTKRPMVARWNLYYAGTCAWECEAGMVEDGPSGVDGEANGPTHWMPLPPPPSEVTREHNEMPERANG